MANSVVSAGKVKSIVEKLEKHPDVAKVILLTLSGSHAYGTNMEGSDVDIRGIFIAKEGIVRTPFKTVTELNIEGEEDGKVYELGTFMTLFKEMNPNIIELGFTDNDSVLYEHAAWIEIKENLQQLVNSNVAFRFSGYAMAQLKRIKGHNKHINNPQPKEMPTQFDYMRLVQSYLQSDPVMSHEVFMRKLRNMNDFCTLVPYGGDIYGVVATYSENGPMFNPDGSIRALEYDKIEDDAKTTCPLFIVKYLRQEHNLAKEKHRNYWTWVENRNAKRHELEVKYGFDTKHAMHLVRLLRMGEEILRTGNVIVKRPDAEELLSIRNGAKTYEEIIKWAEKKDNEIRGELYKNTKLPKRSDLKIAETLIIKAQDLVWKEV